MKTGGHATRFDLLAAQLLLLRRLFNVCRTQAAQRFSCAKTRGGILHESRRISCSELSTTEFRSSGHEQPPLESPRIILQSKLFELHRYERGSLLLCSIAIAEFVRLNEHRYFICHLLSPK